MKKIVCVVLCVLMVAGIASVFVGCTPREEILKIYMPGEYIDEDIFEEFTDWYKEQTGKKMIVKPSYFTAVENIQKAVEGSKADYDLLCPSDYMVEYLISKNLLQKVDKTIINVEQEGLFKQEYIDTTKEFDPTLEYAVPYMYGTLGIVYDRSKTGKEITSWEALFGDEYAGKRSLKDSIRDTYAATCLYNARASLIGLTGADQKNAVQRVFEDTSAETVALAQQTLTNVKNNGGAIWDGDDVKFDMAANKKSAPTVALMWSCDAGYVMNDYEDGNGKDQEGNRNLWYVVPEEGGNVYIDAFVINTYAKNVEAANYFLKFLCQKDVAVKNSEYAGAISPVSEAYDEMLETYTVDEKGMFAGVSAEWKKMFIETMFPTAEILNRCGVMKDFKEGKNAVNTMWSNIQA